VALCSVPVYFVSFFPEYGTEMLYAEWPYAECLYAELLYTECCETECYFAECRYAESRVAILSGISLDVDKLCVIMMRDK
jgi:hypothetical protein